MSSSVISPQSSDVRQWLALSLIPGLGDRSFRKLLEAFGLPQQILAASRAQLSATVGTKLAEAIQSGCDPQALEKTLAWLDEPNHSVLTLADSEYPELLLQTADPPALLYVTGRKELLKAPALAVVGSRNATSQGIANAEAFAKALSENGLTIVSGMALGIDAAAHRGGLAGSGGSIAVVGTGLDRIYPAGNKELAHRLAHSGALISEFPIGTPAIGANFPRRNRIIAGLSKGVLVIEAAISSGSLITARIAADIGREVFALPGSIHSPLAKGNHRLIKQGAKLAESAADILEELQWHYSAPTPQAEEQSNDDPLLRHLGYDPQPIDTLVARSGLSAEEVSARLLQLELQGLVESLPGGRYQRIR